jgi:hypothetical protein
MHSVLLNINTEDVIHLNYQNKSNLEEEVILFLNFLKFKKNQKILEEITEF